MQKNNEVKFEVLRLQPMNTNSVLVSVGGDAVIFDPWGKATDWEKVLLERGLKLRAIYATHGHPDHIAAAPALSRAFDVDWFLNENDSCFIGDARANDFLDRFGLPHIHEGFKKPVNISKGSIEILPEIEMQIIESPGHTPGGLMFYFPKYEILFIGDTLFQESIGRCDFPGGSEQQIFESIHNLYEMNLDDNVYVVHGHGMDTNIGWLKKNNQFFK